MANKETPPFPRGTTMGVTALTDQQQYEGALFEFEDVNWNTQGVKTARTGRLCRCMCVRNVSGISLLPGRLVTFTTTGGSPPACAAQVDGYASATDAVAFAGVVDEWLPAAGVANNDLFWIVVEGPSRCLAPLDTAAAATGPSFSGNTTTFNIGDILVNVTAATSQATTAGRVQIAAATFNVTSMVTDGTIRRHTRNIVGTAMSLRLSNAGTTAGIANQGILVDVRRW